GGGGGSLGIMNPTIAAAVAARPIRRQNHSFRFNTRSRGVRSVEPWFAGGGKPAPASTLTPARGDPEGRCADAAPPALEGLEAASVGDAVVARGADAGCGGA